MRLAVISDIHVLGPGEHEQDQEHVAALGRDLPQMRGGWRRLLHRIRRRFWNWHPESRHACFLKALEEIQAYHPDWIIANGDYGGDTGGVGLSNEFTYESTAGVITLMRELFADRCLFVYGDHELGKYSTNLRHGGIRLDSLYRGEQLLGIQSFWHKEIDGNHLIGVNSVLFTLDLFLPEALEEEIPEWERIREQHRRDVTSAFEQLPADARVLLFCHDPGALSPLIELPAIRARLPQIKLTVLGHLHTPGLLHLARLMSRLPQWNARYPVARIISQSLRGARTWTAFNPIVCPSTFGAGHHVSGGLLFIEADKEGNIVTRRHRVRI